MLLHSAVSFIVPWDVLQHKNLVDLSGRVGPSKGASWWNVLQECTFVQKCVRIKWPPYKPLNLWGAVWLKKFLWFRWVRALGPGIAERPTPASSVDTRPCHGAHKRQSGTFLLKRLSLFWSLPFSSQNHQFGGSNHEAKTEKNLKICHCRWLYISLHLDTTCLPEHEQILPFDWRQVIISESTCMWWWAEHVPIYGPISGCSVHARRLRRNLGQNGDDSRMSVYLCLLPYHIMGRLKKELQQLVDWNSTLTSLSCRKLAVSSVENRLMRKETLQSLDFHTWCFGKFRPLHTV